LAEFIANENNSHHGKALLNRKNIFDQVKQLYQEDLLLYESSVYYVATLNKKIIGSIKITLWDGQAMLPMEKLFGIQCRDLPFTDKLVWHVGRFAISKLENPSGISLLKQLLTLAIYNICMYPNSVMLAECDKKLLLVLKLFGIQTKALAEGVEYLDSETIPIYATDEWLKVFLKNNSYVKQISNIPIINNTAFNSILIEH
jgi:hypothetical protein